MNEIDYQKLINYYKQIMPSINFFNYLYQDCYEKNSNEKVKLDYVPKEEYYKTLVTFCLMSLAIYKDEYLVKENLNINDIGLNFLLKPITHTDLTIDENIELLNKLRHKLLHGDYFVINDELILNDFGKLASIKVVDLYKTCNALYVAQTTFKTKPSKRTMIFTNKASNAKLDTFNDVKRALRDFTIIDFIDKPRQGHERDAEYIFVLESFYQWIKDNCGSTKYTILSELTKLKKVYEPSFNFKNIDLTIKVRKALDSDALDIIKKVIHEYKDDYAKISQKDKYVFLNNLIFTYENENTSVDIYAALMNNAKTIYEYLINDEVNLSNSDYVITSIFGTDEMVAMAALGTFSSVYLYGLEDILSKDLNLKEIVSDEVFDFSSLNLDIAIDSKMDKTLNKKRYESEYVSIKKDLEKQKEYLEIAKRNYNLYLTNTKKINKEKENRLKEDIKQKEDLVNRYSILLYKSDYFFKNKFDKFATNYNVIAHIRNAISHGNYYFKQLSSGDTLLDRVIVFDDIHDGRSTYKAEIRIKDFVTLLSSENIYLIINYVSKLLNEYQKPQEVKKNTLFDKIKKRCKK